MSPAVPSPRRLRPAESHAFARSDVSAGRRRSRPDDLRRMEAVASCVRGNVSEDRRRHPGSLGGSLHSRHAVARSRASDRHHSGQRGSRGSRPATAVAHYSCRGPRSGGPCGPLWSMFSVERESLQQVAKSLARPPVLKPGGHCPANLAFGLKPPSRVSQTSTFSDVGFRDLAPGKWPLASCLFALPRLPCWGCRCAR